MTDGSSNQNRAYKKDRIILSKFISYLSFQGTMTNFRSLNQNASPPWIEKSHIRNLHKCAAEESVQISKESFVRIKRRPPPSSSFFIFEFIDYLTSKVEILVLSGSLGSSVFI